MSVEFLGSVFQEVCSRVLLLLLELIFRIDMASDRMWGGLPFIVPSHTAMKYLYHAKVIGEDEVPVGSHYRAREDMINNVRFGYFSYAHWA